MPTQKNSASWDLQLGFNLAFKRLSKVPVIPVILMKLVVSRQIFEKYLNIKFHENPSSASGVVPRRWTDRRI